MNMESENILKGDFIITQGGKCLKPKEYYPPNLNPRTLEVLDAEDFLIGLTKKSDVYHWAKDTNLMKSLRDHQKRVLELRYKLDLSLDECARIYGVSPQAIGQSEKGALTKLRRGIHDSLTDLSVQ